ncbi:MAG: glycine--tRNA ligase [Candidatus Pacebacteria bacterium]|nr:glycine--tRNA ligase [Candidatus Paceibacterota bacterium]
MSNNNRPTLEEVVALCKRRGFVFPTSEIYGGLTSSYDYGPLGSELLRNIKDLWWKEFINLRPDMVGLDSQIMLNPETWVASGHVGSFSDPMVVDVKTNKRYRADHVIEGWMEGKEEFKDFVVEDLSTQEMGQFIKEHKILSPEGHEFSEPKEFNLLFETSIGAVTGEKSKVYLRGETAQGIFTNFKQVLNSSRVQLPFGIGQLGKSFRNEVTTGQFVFRTLEFEQGEIEYFFDPEKTDWKELFEEWQRKMMDFVINTLGVSGENLRWRQHTDKERSFYSKETYDIDYHFPFGWKELWGLAYRTDYDLTQQMKHSGESLEYTDPHTQKRMIPHVIEPAVGIGRLFLMTLVDAYWKDEENNRIVLKLHPRVAPYKAAVFPLLKNKPELVGKAKDIFNDLSRKYPVIWDERGNIGKRYLYQDEIGTPVCITVDFESLEDESVTIRNRDTTKQERIKITQLEEYLANMLD